ncbi:MAG: hypothetical protein VX777_03480 [Chlamydiota bacterium]|nr:hypothetical protein [Chlamydiota bacterium]
MGLLRMLIMSVLFIPFYALSLEKVETEVEELVPVIPDGISPEEEERIRQNAWFDLQIQLREDQRYREKMKEQQRERELRQQRIDEQREREKRREEERRRYQREQENKRAEELRMERRRMEQRRLDEQRRNQKRR